MKIDWIKNILNKILPKTPVKSKLEILVVGTVKEWEWWLREHYGTHLGAIAENYLPERTLLKVEYSFGEHIYRFLDTDRWELRCQGLLVDNILYLGGEKQAYPARMINILSSRLRK
jgi:hypothetical protein